MNKSLKKTLRLNILPSRLFFVVAFLAFFFIISPKSFAKTDIPVNPTLFTSTTRLIGHIDTSIPNKVEVCKDPTCTNPKPGIIDFNISNGSPLVIDSQNGLSGQIYGDELGFINFKPSYGGVFIANIKTGLLKGTALSDNSEVINFSVTGQQVNINPVTGEWSGWAWVSGPYGGWIKFNCASGSCVKTIWDTSKEVASTTPPTQITSVVSNSNTKVKEVFNSALSYTASWFSRAIDNTKSFSIKTTNNIEKGIGSAYKVSISSFSNFSSRAIKFFNHTYSSIISSIKK